MRNFPVLRFLNEVRGETSKVSWPSRNQTIKLTIIVLAVSLVISAYAFSLDLLFQQLIKLLLSR